MVGAENATTDAERLVEFLIEAAFQALQHDAADYLDTANVEHRSYLVLKGRISSWLSQFGVKPRSMDKIGRDAACALRQWDMNDSGVSE